MKAVGAADCTGFTAFCIGEQTARPQNKYYKNVKIAENATIERLIDCVLGGDHKCSMTPFVRAACARRTGLRRMVRETRISPESLIWPIFVAEGEGIYEEIPSLPGQYHYSPDQLYRMVERARAHGVSRVILFGLPKEKDEIGSGAWAEDGIVQQGIRKIKELAPEMYVITDVCMCEYTSARPLRHPVRLLMWTTTRRSCGWRRSRSATRRRARTWSRRAT